jgi:thiol-disulfide isomerase/thioredoxin
MNKRAAILMLILAMVLAACGGNKGEASSFIEVELSDFPVGIGRGFPAAVADRDRQAIAAIGQPAPDFTMVLEDGRGVPLRALQGKPVLINFWATWCPPCRAEMPDLVALHNENPDLQLVSVNVGETQDVVERFSEAFDMTMPVVVDEEGVVSDMYAVRNMPTTVFIDREGQVVYLYKGILTPDLLASFVSLVQ